MKVGRSRYKSKEEAVIGTQSTLSTVTDYRRQQRRLTEGAEATVSEMFLLLTNEIFLKNIYTEKIYTYDNIVRINA